MTDIVSMILRWALRIGILTTSIFAFIVVLNLASSLLFVTLNQNALSDIFALIQIWLPFNLTVILSWFTTATLAYIVYRLSRVAFNFIDDLVKS